MTSSLLSALGRGFAITVEVVPPAGPDPEALLERLGALRALPIYGFSVSSNPMARPRMSALAFASLLQNRIDRPAILHCTTRDANSLGLKGLLWGARAAGIAAVLATSGDRVARAERSRVSTVRDMDVFELIRLAREQDLETGVVINFRQRKGALMPDQARLERKVAAGAQFAVSQPLFDRAGALSLASVSRDLGIPVLLGILQPKIGPVLFQKRQVAGIEIPEAVLRRLERAADPAAEGLLVVREMLDIAREMFAGACLMPPLDRHKLLSTLIAPERERPSDSP